MTTLDYAHIFETQYRPRRRLRLLLKALAVIVFALWPLAAVALLTLGQ